METNTVEEPKHTFNLPTCILNTMLCASRFLVCIQMYYSDITILNMILMILFYYIVMEGCIAISLYMIKYLPIVLKDPSSFINKHKVSEIISNDSEYQNFITGITTITYLMIFFL